MIKIFGAFVLALMISLGSSSVSFAAANDNTENYCCRGGYCYNQKNYNGGNCNSGYCCGDGYYCN